MSDLSDPEQYDSEQESDDSVLTDRKIRQFNREIKKQEMMFEEDMKKEKVTVRRAALASAKEEGRGGIMKDGKGEERRGEEGGANDDVGWRRPPSRRMNLQRRSVENGPSTSTHNNNFSVQTQSVSHRKKN